VFCGLNLNVLSNINNAYMKILDTFLQNMFVASFVSFCYQNKWWTGNFTRWCSKCNIEESDHI
jgi:hypothetical protein